jgi:NADPH-dependent curcumin reductase CurA
MMRLVQKEDAAVGPDNAPGTLPHLFSGENLGKRLLRITDAACNAGPGELGYH